VGRVPYYRETTEHNRRTYGLAWEERDDSRIQRRAEVYVQFLSACERAIFVAQDVYSNPPGRPRDGRGSRTWTTGALTRVPCQLQLEQLRLAQ
jgi:hypothetical protein